MEEADELLQLPEQQDAVQQCSAAINSLDLGAKPTGDMATRAQVLHDAPQQQGTTASLEEGLKDIMLFLKQDCAPGVSEWEEQAMEEVETAVSVWDHVPERGGFAAITCMWFGSKATGAATPDEHFDLALLNIPGLATANSLRLGPGVMPREQRFGRSVLKSLEHYLSDRGLLQEGFNWKNFGQASPFVEAELMLGDSLQPFRVRFHVYIPEGLASLVERTRSEMLQLRLCGPKMWLVSQLQQQLLKHAAEWHDLFLGNTAAVSRALSYVLRVWDKQPGQQGVWGSADLDSESAAAAAAAAGPDDPAALLTRHEIKRHLQYLSQQLQQSSVTSLEVWQLAIAVGECLSDSDVSAVHVDLGESRLDLHMAADGPVSLAGLTTTHQPTEQPEVVLDRIAYTATQQVMRTAVKQMKAPNIGSRIAKARSSVLQLAAVLQPHSNPGYSGHMQGATPAAAARSELCRRQQIAGDELISRATVPAILTMLVRPSAKLKRESRKQQETGCSILWGFKPKHLAAGAHKIARQAKDAASVRQYILAAQLCQSAVIEMAEAVGVIERAGAAAMSEMATRVVHLARDICSVEQMVDKYVAAACKRVRQKLKLYKSCPSESSRRSLEEAHQQLDAARAQQEAVDDSEQEVEHLLQWVEDAIVAERGDVLAVAEAAVDVAACIRKYQEQVMGRKGSPQPPSKRRRLL